MAVKRNKKNQSAKTRLQKKQAKTLDQAADKSTPTTDSPPQAYKDGFPIVGIGASAGGLEAIQGFVSRLPSDVDIAFVIVQHLPPDHKSVMGSLLQKHCQISVSDIEHGEKVRPNHIYLNAPECNVDLVRGVFNLVKTTKVAGLNLPIDHFFRSLAEDRADRSIGIILSGTGSDGTLGLKAIKNAGGMTMVQDPDQAKYDGMPRNAIDTGLVDFILPVEKMADELTMYIQHPYIRAEKPNLPAEKLEAFMQKIFTIVRQVTGHDFSHYKRSTIRRRIERRMAVHQIESIADYHHYLRENPAEAETLFKDLLITVTSFFRDPEAWVVLHDKVLVPLVENQRPDIPIRAWVPGCATGEEAYSLAMLLLETMDRLDKHLNFQIFATDLDADALEQARKGDYPQSIAADVSPERLHRFFNKHDARYTIKKQIREMIVFAVHNLIKDAPFSRLDLVNCRNLLIYLEGDLQKKIMPLFHYTLNPNGALFLGTAENIGESSEYFVAVDFKWKIFRTKPAAYTTAAPLYELSAGHRQPAARPAQPRPEADLRHVAERIILQDYGWPCVFVNNANEVVYFHANTEKFLRQPGGQPSLDIIKMARPEIRQKLSTAIHLARNENRTVTSESITLRSDDDFFTFDLLVRPATSCQKGQKENLLMVIFQGPPQHRKPEEYPKQARAKKADRQTEDPRIAALEEELQSTRQYLHTTVEELETSNEELRSSNEELHSTNEELQSTNEELETSREELQSTNEELETVNAELRSKVNQLGDLNNDITNLLSGTNIATIFLDNSLHIKRFTPAVKDMFNLIPADVGRPLTDIAHKLRYENFYRDARHVLHHLGTLQHEIQTDDNRWYLMRIMPYRTAENTIDGVVATFSDVNAQKEAQIAATLAKKLAEAVVEAVGKPLIVLDRYLRVVSANRAFYNRFALSPDTIRNKEIFEIEHSPFPAEPLRQRLRTFVAKGAPVEDLMLPEKPEKNAQHLRITARQIRPDDKEVELILLMIETEQKMQ